MTSSLELLDAVKARYNLPSYYATAKKIGLTQQAVSLMRSRGTSFSDTTALRVASLLEMDPCYVLAVAHSERAGSGEEKAAWLSMVNRLAA